MQNSPFSPNAISLLDRFRGLRASDWLVPGQLSAVIADQEALQGALSELVSTGWLMLGPSAGSIPTAALTDFGSKMLNHGSVV